MKLFLSGIFALLFCSPVFSQIQFDSTAIRILLSDSLSYHRTYCRQPIAWDDFAFNPGNAIKVDSILYFIPDQYGAIFKIQQKTDSIQVIRIDHTKYSGLTAGQYCFYDKHLYSFGGYGFWHTNGQLRIYVDDKKEWDIVKLNEIVPSTNYFTWYDPAENMLWCGRQDYVNEVLDSKTFKTGLNAYRLNLKEQKWENLGSLNYTPTNTTVYEGIYLETPYGILVNEGGPKFRIWNFKENSKYDIGSISDSLRMLFIGTMLIGEHSLFIINHHILIYDHASRKMIKKMAFDQSSLTLQKSSVYKELSSGLSHYWIYLLMLLPLALLLYYHKHVQNLLQHMSFRKSSVDTTIKQAVLLSPNAVHGNGEVHKETTPQVFLRQLTNLETELLKQISRDTKNGFRTKAEDINRILGTERKSTDVQKKQRHEVLVSINHKYAKLYNTTHLLIEKVRTEDDGRLFEYYINQNIDSNFID